MWPEVGEATTYLNSFHHPLPVMDSEPDDGPLLCISFNAAWRSVICGALLQLIARQTWDQSDPDALFLQQERSYKLLKMFGLAEACPVQEDGLLTLTITAGTASVSGDIVFSGVYATTPKVDVSCDNGDLIASWGAVTVFGATLTLTAATPVAVDTVGTISWSTNA